MHSHDAETSTHSEAPEAVATQRPEPLSLAIAPQRLSARDALGLQRTVGNRAVARIALARAPAKDPFEEKRAMREGAEKSFYKPDVEFTGPEGDLFVFDPFDRTLTIFTPKDGPNKGQAIRMTYVEGSAEDLAKLDPKDLFSSTEVLSPLRAKALQWLRGEAGTYQEDEAGRKERLRKVHEAGEAKRAEWVKTPGNQALLDKYKADVTEYNQGVQDWKDKKRKLLPAAVKAPPGMPQDARVTSCNLHTGEFGAAVLGVNTGGMDPRQDAINNKRGGAFRTLESNPEGPKAGDIMSYGPVFKATKAGGLRRTNFVETKHVGVFKSRRPGPSAGSEIWTVVDGGQGSFEGRQETRERTRVFARERMLVQIPKRTDSGKFSGFETELVEMDVGVMKSKYADAGQSDEDKILRGWVDIDDYFGGTSEATAAGAGNRVFPGKPEPVPVST